MTRRFRPIFFVLLLACLGFTGCGKDEASEPVQSASLRWGSFPVEIQVEDYFYSDAASFADFNDAVALWEAQAGKQLFVIRGPMPNGTKPFTGSAGKPDQITANAIFFENPWPFSPDVAGQSILHGEQNITKNAVIMINPGTNFCHGDCVGRLNQTSLRKLFAHELGHFLGLLHSDNTKDIMFPEIQSGGSLGSVEINAGALMQLVN